MKSAWAAAVLVLACAGPALAQGKEAPEAPSAALAMSALAAPGLELVDFSRLYDAAKAGLHQAVFARPGAAAAAAARALPAARPQPAPRLMAPVQRIPDLVVPSPVVTPAYRHTFSVLLAHPEVTDRYDDLILKYSYKHHLDARLVKSVIAAESEFFLGAISPRGAHGLMQVMPATAAMFGVSRAQLFTPEGAIAAGTAYLAELFEIAWKRYKLKGVRYHDVPLWVKQRIIAAYNAGPRFLFSDRFYPQTRNYVRKVLLFYRSRVTDFRRPARPASEYPSVPLPQSAAAL